MPRVLFLGLIVSFGLFAGRLSGFVREIFISSIYGASAYSDVVIVLLTIPDVLVNLLVGGALGMALIPEFNSFSAAKAKFFYLQVLYLMFALFVAATIFLSFFSMELLRVFSPGLSVNLINDAQYFLRISLCAIPFTVAAGVTTAFLQYKQKFVVPAFTTLIFNVVLVLILYMSQFGKNGYFFYYLSGGIIFGAVIRWVALLINDDFFIYKNGFHKQFLVSKKVISRYLYCVISSGFMFMIPVIVRAAASNNGAGSLSITNYALKLVELPLAVVLTVFSIIFIPKFAKLFVDGREEQFSNVLAVVTIILTFISLIVFSSMSIFSHQFVSLVYGWGALTPVQLNEISETFKLALFSLTFQGLNSFFIAACSARKDTFTPFILTSIVVIAFLVATFVFAFNLRNLLILMNAAYLFITIGLVFVLYSKHKQQYIFNGYFFKKICIAGLIVLIYFRFLSIDTFSGFSAINVVGVCVFGGIISMLIFFIFNRDFQKVISDGE